VWGKLKTYEEKINAYNIPDSLLKNISTKDLVETCLNYPDIILLMSRDNIQQGYDILKPIFNGFSELEKREDAGTELIKLYQNIDPAEIVNLKTPDDRGIFSFNLTFLELLLAQKTILQDLSEKGRINLLSLSTSMYKKKISIIKYYAIFGLTTPCLISGRLLEIQNSELLNQLILNNPNIQMFLDRFFITKEDDLDKIIKAGLEYLQTKGYE